MSSVDPTNSATNSSSSASNSNSKLGQNEFLKLMMEQMKNQDPFKPQDPSAFIGQLAQFSTVTGIQNMEDKLTDLADSMRESQVLSGTNLVGHSVLADSDQAYIQSGETVYGAADVPAGASKVTVNIRDSAGTLVRTMQMDTTEGLNSFTWDGKTSKGTTADTGNYSFEVIATVGGESESLTTQIASKVESVTIDSKTNALKLNTNNGTIKLSDVRQVI